MALLVVKYYTSMLRQIQDIRNLSFVFLDIFFDAGYTTVMFIIFAEMLLESIFQFFSCLLFQSDS